MESVVGELQGLSTGSPNLLGLPEPCPWDSDDELLGIGGIKPKSSPIPRRRSSLSCSDDDSQPPPSGSRRVSFADAFGLSLVSVKQFDTRSMCDPADPLEVDFKGTNEYFVKLLFILPLTLEELHYRVQEQKVHLENLELLPETTTLKGTVRVLNMCFDKLVYIRTSLDIWRSHFDLLAEYAPESSDNVMDCFSFKLTLVPPFGEQGDRVDFCIRYETPLGTFWDNNSGQNYVLFCHEKSKDKDENEILKPKSCLKPSSHSLMTNTTSNAEEIPEIILNCGIATVTQPGGAKEEKIQDEQVEVKEEISRNYSRRRRRKAARMVKLQQYFAQRDENDFLQTEKGTDGVPAIDEAPLNLSTLQRNDTYLLLEPVENKGEKSVADSMDADRNQLPASQTQEKDSILVKHPELIISISQTGQQPFVDSQLWENSQDKQTVTNQTVSPKCQTSDKLIGKSVERAWDCFEKCAKERLGSTAEIHSNADKTQHEDNTHLENSQASQSFGYNYTFETIVAPLYHEVFERMENNSRGIKNSISKADSSVGKLDDGSLRVVTYPSVETRSNPEISAKHEKDDDHHGAHKETFPGCLHNTRSADENVLAVSDVNTKPVAEIACQDTALPDITDNLLDANMVKPTEKQRSSNSPPSISWKESTIVPTEKRTQIIILQSKGSDNTEYSQDKKSPDSKCLLDTTQQELICANFEDTKTTKLPPSIVSENRQSEDRSVTQTAFQMQISDEINKVQDRKAWTLTTHISCLEEGYTLVPESTLFHSDISSQVMPKINQSQVSSPFQDLTQATIQLQIPAAMSFAQSLEMTGDKDPQKLQTADAANMIQKATITCHNGDNQDESEAKSNSRDGNDIEIIQEEIIYMSPQEQAVERLPQNIMEPSQFNKNVLYSDEITDFVDFLGKDMPMLNISSSPDNPEYLQLEEVKENIHLKNPVKTEPQELPDMTESQSEKVTEIWEVEKQLEEQGEEDKQKDQVENAEQQRNEKGEVGNDKCKDGSYYTEDEKEVKMDDKEKDAQPGRSEVQSGDEKDLEVEINEQVMVNGAMSVATLQRIPNMESHIKEVHLHVGQEQQYITSLEQMPEEPESESHAIFRGEEVFCQTDSSQQALTVNNDVVSGENTEEVDNSSEQFFDQEEDVCRQIDKKYMAEDEVDTLLENPERSENIEDSTSTDSLTDDEIELYLLRLKSSQQPELKDAISMGKRHSISRTWTVKAPMPSISEYVDEDQPNALLDDLTDEQMIELEQATLPLLDTEEDIAERNLLWWRDFFSSDNMPKMIVYTLLLVVFLITTYVCDFIACFGLYLLAVYWLYFQVQGVPLKGA